VVGLNVPNHKTSRIPKSRITARATVRASLKNESFIGTRQVGDGEFGAVVVVEAAPVLNFDEFHMFMFPFLFSQFTQSLPLLIVTVAATLSLKNGQS
jgi:hypothetical protein